MRWSDVPTLPWLMTHWCPLTIMQSLTVFWIIYSYFLSFIFPASLYHVASATVQHIYRNLFTHQDALFLWDVWPGNIRETESDNEGCVDAAKVIGLYITMSRYKITSTVTTVYTLIIHLEQWEIKLREAGNNDWNNPNRRKGELSYITIFQRT